MIENISAITLATHDMARAVRFYRMLGFEVLYGGDAAAFTSFRAGTSYLNLIAQPAERTWSWWGRVIFYHSDVDSLHAGVIAAGYRPDTAPRDAETEVSEPVRRGAPGNRARRNNERPRRRNLREPGGSQQPNGLIRRTS